jgi:peptidoglycan/LPS O-acetylase OafA/YrhL
LPGLDGLRAVAVSLVFFQHFYQFPKDQSVLHRVSDQGGFGVEIFFVLSGFLITYLVLREERGTGSISLKLFYARRALRILPPLVLFLFAISLGTTLGVINVPAADIAASLCFLRNYVGDSPETGHLWTLAIEEQFYLIWPITLIVVKSFHLRLFIGSAIIVLTPFWTYVYIQKIGHGQPFNSWRTDLRFSPLAVGGLLALLLTNTTGARILTSRIVCNFYLCVGAIAFISLNLLTDVFNMPVVKGFRSTFNTIAVALIINCLIHGRAWMIGSVMESRIFIWVGTLSYSLYLWQQPFAPNLPRSTLTWYKQFPVGLTWAPPTAR